MKHLITILLSALTFPLAAQIFSPEVSSGILYAETRTLWPVDDERKLRRGAWLTLSNDFKLKQWFSIEAGISYQERMPLEDFYFRHLVPPPNGGSTGVQLGKWPTHPQHPLFDEGVWPRFPNFKYLGLEFIPTVSFGKVWSISVGSGFFGSLLLNKEDAKVTPEDLGTYKELFGNRLDEVHNIEYKGADFGVVPKISFRYQMSPQLTIGIQVKSYQSLVRLNDHADPTRQELLYNLRWAAYAGGLSVQYRFR